MRGCRLRSRSRSLRSRAAPEGAAPTGSRAVGAGSGRAEQEAAPVGAAQPPVPAVDDAAPDRAHACGVVARDVAGIALAAPDTEPRPFDPRFCAHRSESAPSAGDGPATRPVPHDARGGRRTGCGLRRGCAIASQPTRPACGDPELARRPGRRRRDRFRPPGLSPGRAALAALVTLLGAPPTLELLLTPRAKPDDESPAIKLFAGVRAYLLPLLDDGDVIGCARTRRIGCSKSYKTRSTCSGTPSSWRPRSGGSANWWSRSATDGPTAGSTTAPGDSVPTPASRSASAAPTASRPWSTAPGCASRPTGKSPDGSRTWSSGAWTGW